MSSPKRQRREVASVPLLSASIDPRDFFIEHVLARKPAQFSSHITDDTWKADKWSNDFLRERSGETILRVESRNNANESFGRGIEKKLKFGAFLDSLADDRETSYYLTTQELSYTHEGQPSLTSPPIDGLIGDFPWLPKLCGNLIPQNINMWFGSSKLSTSSGLHHDFHDNLYILLRGEKRITLFSPAEALNMYTVGEIVKIHPNGRINYKNTLTNADGSDAASLVALKASTDLEAAAALLAGAEEEDLELAEQRMEDALEALLDAEIAGNEDDGMDDEEEGDDEDEDEDSTGYEQLNLLRKLGDDGDGEGSDLDGDEEDDGDSIGDGFDSDDGDGNGDGSDTCLPAGITIASKKANADSKTNVNASTALKQSVGHESSSSSSSSKVPGKLKQHSSVTGEEEEGQGISITNAASHSLAGDSTSIGSPPNFSRVDTALPLESLKVMFPLYYEALTNSSIRSGSTGSSSSSSSSSSDSSSSSSSGSSSISNGAILPSVKTSDSSKSSDHSTLPSSIVSSSGVRCMEVTIKAGEMLFIPAGWFHEVRSTGGGKVGHLALNYWFHPPDGSTFEKPYTSDFWVNDWKRRNLK